VFGSQICSLLDLRRRLTGLTTELDCGSTNHFLYFLDYFYSARCFGFISTLAIVSQMSSNASLCLGCCSRSSAERTCHWPLRCHSSATRCVFQKALVSARLRPLSAKGENRNFSQAGRIFESAEGLNLHLSLDRRW